MKTYRTLFLLSLLTLGCTAHQEDRLRELLTVQQSAFPRIKDISVVKESLTRPSTTFSLSLEPGDLLTTEKGSFPTWLLQGKNIPEKERFVFAIVDPFEQKIDPQYEFELLENGQVQIFGKTGPRIEDAIAFIENKPFPSGTPVQYVIVSKKSYTSASVDFIPYPLFVSGEKGESVALQVSHHMGTHFSLTARGFSPHEKVKLIHTSGSLQEETEIVADEAGSFSIGLNPTVLGRMGGEASLTVVQEDHHFTLDYPWGAHLQKRALQEKALFPILFVMNQESDGMDAETLATHFAALAP